MPDELQINNQEKEENGKTKIRLTDKQMNEFQKVMKRGIYRELYQKELLTGSQLDFLLSRIS